MSADAVPNVDPTFYRMIGELTGEVRGLKESLDFRTRQTEVQIGEIRADIRTTKHDTNNQRMKLAAVEQLLDHGFSDLRDRVVDVERRIEILDAKITHNEKPIEELMTWRVRAIAWLGGVSAGGGILWMFIGHRLIAAMGWILENLPEKLP